LVEGYRLASSLERRALSLASSLEIKLLASTVGTAVEKAVVAAAVTVS